MKLFFAAFFVLVSSLHAATFTHPGILHSSADLERMRDMVQAGRQPWARGFEKLRAAPHSAKDYVLQGPFKVVGYENGQYEFRRDATAAYNQALLWAVTGDADYAKKAREILNAWAGTMESFDKGDHITGGMGTQKLAIAAEILRFLPNSGWTENDTTQFKSFLEKMRPSVDKPNLFLNQGGYGMLGMISIAVFLEDEELYRKTIMRATIGDHQDYRKDASISKCIWPSGQVVEMGRDQTHPQGGLGSLACIAQTASIQGPELSGVDLFDYLDRRLLKGYGYMAGHELGYDRVYEPLDEQVRPGLYEKFQNGDRGRFAPIYELVYQHYRHLKNVAPEELRYVAEVRDYQMPEGGNDDFPGFGTLTFTLPESAENVPPLGPPAPLVAAAKVPSDRHLAANFDATHGVGREYYTDAFGVTRLIASNIQANDYVRYDRFNFGSEPVDTFLASAGSASGIGSKIDILLDSLESEPVGTLQVENTGWWSTFATFSTKMRRPVSGEHALFLRFYGGKHVYKFECNLDWFKFGNTEAIAKEMKIESAKPRFPVISGVSFAAAATGAATKSGTEVVLEKDGTTISFCGVEFANGAQALAVKIAGSGMLEFRSNDRGNSPFATVKIPEQMERVVVPLPADRLTGNRMLFLTCQGSTGPVRLAEFQLDPK